MSSIVDDHLLYYDNLMYDVNQACPNFLTQGLHIEVGVTNYQSSQRWQRFKLCPTALFWRGIVFPALSHKKWDNLHRMILLIY